MKFKKMVETHDLIKVDKKLRKIKTNMDRTPILKSRVSKKKL